MVHPLSLGLGLIGVVILSLSGTGSAWAADAKQNNASLPLNGGTLTWGGALEDVGQATVVDAAGNVYITGYFYSTVDFDPASGSTSQTAVGGRDVFLSKFDSGGSLVWVRTWGGSGDDTGNGIAVDGDGNVFVSGRYQNTVDFNPGNPVDSHTSLSGAANDAFVSKFDPSGSFQWARTWGGTFGDEAYGVVADAVGNSYVVGDFSSPSVDFDPGIGVDSHANLGLFDAFLTKFDPEGAFLWAKSWGGALYDDGPRVVVDGLGNVYIAGMFQSQPGDFDPGTLVDNHWANGSIDVFLSKFNSDGGFLWARTWGGTDDDCGEALAVDGSGNVYVTGYFANTVDFDPGSGVVSRISHGDRDVYLSKLDTNGNYLWAKTWGGSGDDRGESVYLDGSGGVYLTGWYNGTVDFNIDSGVEPHTSNGGFDAFLSKLDTLGNYEWTKTWGGTGVDAGIGIAGRGSERIYVAGWYNTTVNFAPWSASGDSHTANGGGDVFLAVFIQYPFFLPAIRN